MYTTRFLFSLLLPVVVIGLTEQTKDCPSNKSNLAVIKLKNDLFCNYDKTFRPLDSNKTPVSLQIGLTLKYFAFEIRNDIFNIDGSVILTWTDERLEWKPAEYDSIDVIQLPIDELWIPDVSVVNRRVFSGNPVIVNSVPCILYSSGNILCIVPIHLNVFCVGDITNYPFDTQNCTVRFESWIHNGEQINITYLYNSKSRSIDTEMLVPNGDWALVEKQTFRHSKKYKCCPETYLSIDFSFKIRRLAGAHAASVTLPALALIIITLISLWLPLDHPNRLSLCCVNLLCEFLYLQHVSILVPLRGNKVSLILLFARDSLLLSVFTVVSSVILKSVAGCVKPAPGWITNAVSILTTSRAGRIICSDELSNTKYAIQDEGSNETLRSNSKNREWIIFAKVLDRLCFVIYVIVYLVLHFSTVFSLLGST